MTKKEKYALAIATTGTAFLNARTAVIQTKKAL
jgi:hypothetical protein